MIVRIGEQKRKARKSYECPCGFWIAPGMEYTRRTFRDACGEIHTIKLCGFCSTERDWFGWTIDMTDDFEEYLDLFGAMVEENYRTDAAEQRADALYDEMRERQLWGDNF